MKKNLYGIKVKKKFKEAQDTDDTYILQSWISLNEDFCPVCYLKYK